MTGKAAVLLDTSFMIRFVNAGDQLHAAASGYFDYFMRTGTAMYISTIAVAEFCVRGEIQELPMKNVLPLSFDSHHAIRAGRLARIAFEARSCGILSVGHRLIIPNDVKMFAQADMEEPLGFFLSADSEAGKIYNSIARIEPLAFKFIDIRETSCGEAFGTLPGFE